MRSIELFAGAGGLGLGAALAGFTPVAVVEWDADCRETLRFNGARGPLADWPVPAGDVRHVDFTRHEGRVDVVTGGPPCQPFSIGGKHKAQGDTRDMFPQAARALREAKPRAFILENVKGLARAGFAPYLDYIRLQTTHPEVVARPDEGWESHRARLARHDRSGSRAGPRYDVSIHLVNAADHGVPQRRERLFLVGFRADLAIDWRFPQATHSAEALALAQERDGPYWKRHGIAAEDRPARRVGPVERNAARNTLPWRTVRDALSGMPDPEHDPVAAARHAGHRFQPGARAYPGHTGSPLDAPAKALKAGVHGVPGGENMLRRPDGAVRYFTVRESARLQTFPDDFLFPGSWSETMRQLGNAVPVTLARIVAGAVFERLRDERETGSAAARFDQKSGNPHAASLL